MTSASAEERRLGVRLLGWLYLTGAVMSVVTLLLAAGSVADPTAVLVAGSLSIPFAIALLRAQPTLVLLHVGFAGGLVASAMVLVSTGASASPGRWLLPLAVAFASVFFPTRTALLYVAGICAIHALPLVYDPHAGRQVVPELLVAIPAYLLIAAGGLRTLQVGLGLRHRAQRLADEHAALERVATEAVAARSPDQVYARLAGETSRLLSATASAVIRFEEDGSARVLGCEGWRGSSPGSVLPVSSTSELAQVRDLGLPVHTRDTASGTLAGDAGCASAVVAPVLIGERVWGALAAMHDDPDGLPRDADLRLAAFGEVLALAVTSAEDRTRLAAQATTDELTSLANRRAFHAALNTEVSRAQRHGRPLSIAVVDIDWFKQVNDSSGHEVGDRVLTEVAARLSAAKRAEDVLGRLGGDELAWLMPETPAFSALAAVERVRADLAARPLSDGRVTISAGICEHAGAQDADALVRGADAALYWSKAQGRDMCWVYDPEVIRRLSDEERTRHLERSKALIGLRAIARAIDTKDPSMREHSERVSELASRLAQARRWPPSRVALLQEAALVHDVGKIGISDTVLLKPGRLTPEEHDLVKEHVEIGARIVADLLGAEQVEWIRGHHERPDGAGYPRGLAGPEISEGAELLALADAYDVMVRARPYSAGRTPSEAIVECRSLAGAQFAPAAVRALEEVLSGDAPPPPEAAPTGSRLAAG